MHLGPHTHDEGHWHPPGAARTDHQRLNRSFALAVVLNVVLVAGEVVGGWMAGSMALLADAGHNLSDVAGLVLAWGAHWLRGRRRDGRWTYGWRSFTILAANINGLLLVVAIVGVSGESVRRLYSPTEVAEVPVLFVALIAAGLNFATASLLAGGSKEDLNVRGAHLHMLADAAVSVAVVIGAAAMLVTGWSWIDPAVSLGICIVLVFSTWGLLRESLTMLMHAAPRQLDLDEIRKSLESYGEIARVEDLHVWSVSTTEALLTARLRCPDLSMEEQDQLLQRLHAELRDEFAISHATLEVTRQMAENGECSLDLT